ncbi:class I SAM-dependent methyltransferase [Mesorhizobium sp. BAC0120]|uniref:class I SAM-dependent methyltransferase n=1 Tax=Mesorhizobium sp. BAC0120 TaxID=3090670 RepID=UPI00298D38A6|nr:class I SAM-dependent methyltransferase [Mesorhizobium sp. BAC0120]MDW6022411.1 class I SAM-dependent methyltransferase [Mesorhizobium sp. BAC0120]
MGRLDDWRSFWDSDHSIYVNARHKDVHYGDVADQIAAMVRCPAARVLDYGCGEAIHADRVARKAARFVLSDSAPTVREALSTRFAGEPRIEVLSPEEVAKLPDADFDLIVANSLVQYLTSGELDRLLVLWRRLLSPRGVLVVADVIPPTVGALSDVGALLRYAARHGFLFAALLGLAHSATSGYGALRKQLGLSQYTEAAFIEKLRAAGYSAERLPSNIEHNPARMTFRARPVRTLAPTPC